MEDYLEVLIFLAFAAFSLFSQWLDRKRKAVTRAPKQEVEGNFEQPRDDDPPVTARPPRRRSAPKRSTPSMEEILRELTGQSSPQEVKEEYEDDYELPPHLQEQQPRADTTPQKLSDKISLEDTGKRIEPIKLAKKRPSRSALGPAVARSLRHPDSAKRAVILSEILQRKHF